MEYFEDQGLDKEIEYLYSESMVQERRNKEKFTRASIHQLIKSEYKALRNLVANKEVVD